MPVWEFIAQMYRGVDWRGLILSHGVIGAALCYLALQALRVRNQRRRLAKLETDLTALMDHKVTTVEQKVGDAEARGRELLQQSESFRLRVDQVENRIPSLYDHMEESRNTLARIFQNELGAVLGSFDSSVAAMLDHMKADLHAGIARIESIEEMVRRRQKAGRELLVGVGAPSLPEAEERSLDLEIEEQAVAEEPGPDLMFAPVEILQQRADDAEDTYSPEEQLEVEAATEQDDAALESADESPEDDQDDRARAA